MFFEKMQNRKNDGFTLVELIVVIAILAILAGIGVPAYSGYVEKANIAADQQLISEVENALHLAFYSDRDFVGGSVALSATAAPSVANDSLKNALIAVYGSEEAVNALRLKSSGWASSYSQSSFYGKEVELLTQVDTMTSTLEDAILDNSSLVGAGFGGYLANLGLENTTENASKVADAAVLYVAQNTSKLTEEQRAQYAACLANFPATRDTTFTSDFTSAFGGLNVTSAAALYGFAEAYFQYEAANGSDAGLTALRNGIENVDTTDTTTALNGIVGAIADAMSNADSTLASGYFTGGAESKAAKDGLAYLDIMDTVTKAEDQFIDGLGTENSFSTTGATLFASYAAGAAVITARTTSEGEFEVILPVHP